jgi:hypothetical protein
VAHARAAEEQNVWPSARRHWSLQVTSHGAACDVGFGVSVSVARRAKRLDCSDANIGDANEVCAKFDLFVQIGTVLEGEESYLNLMVNITT